MRQFLPNIVPMTGLLSRMSATFIITLLFLQAVMAYELGAPNCNFALSKRGLSNAHCRSLCEDVEFKEATPHEFSRECSFEYYDAHGVASSNTCVGNTSIASRAYTRLSDVHSFAECQDLCREQEDCAWVMARSKGDALSCEYVSSRCPFLPNTASSCVLLTCTRLSPSLTDSVTWRRSKTTQRHPFFAQTWPVRFHCRVAAFSFICS